MYQIKHGCNIFQGRENVRLTVSFFKYIKTGNLLCNVRIETIFEEHW